MGSIAKEVERELPPFLRVFKDGTVERFQGAPIVPPFTEDPETGVSSKDIGHITISNDPPISARLYLPKLAQPDEKLPVLVYFHGGGFCIESAFSLTETKFMTRLVSYSKVVAISVEYRLAPESPLPIAFEDCWTALQWVALHNDKNKSDNRDEWISKHGDFSHFYIGGDSAGANIAHNIVMRVGKEGLKGDVKLKGTFLTHPYFWGSKAIGLESDIDREQHLPYRVWSFLYPSAPGGLDNPMINPVVPGAPSLAGLAGSKLLVTVSEKDELMARGYLYFNAVKESGWKGEVEVFEVEGEDHAFHILNFETEKAKNFIRKIASFLLK